MKRIISLLVVMAMMLASVLAIVPVSATGSANNSDQLVGDTNNDATTEEEEVVETTRFLPAGALNAFTQAWEADPTTTQLPFVNGVTPFAFAQAEAQAKFSGKRILNVTLPLKEVGTADDNGKVKFTITVLDMDDVAKVGSPIAVHEVLVDAATLTVGKMTTIDLTPYAINVGPGETLVFGSKTDTLLPGWYNDASSLYTLVKGKAATETEEAVAGIAPWTTGIYGLAGTKADNTPQNGNSIFLDFEMRELTDKDGVVGTAVTTEAELAAMKDGYNYYLANDLTLSAEWASKVLNNVTFDGNGKTITLSGTNGLFGDVTNSTVKNFTLAGDVTTTTGVAMKVTNVTFKGVTVSLKAVANGGNCGVFASGSAGNLTVLDCTNNTPISANNAAAIIGKFDGDKFYIDGFTNNANVTGQNTGATITGWYSSGNSLIAKNVVNLGTITANNWVAGMIGANYANGAELINCVNGSKDDATKGAIGGSCTKIGGFVSESTKPLKLTNCENYADIILKNSNDGYSVAGFVAMSNNNITVVGGGNYGNVKAVKPDNLDAIGDAKAAALVASPSGGIIDVDGFVNKGNISSGFTAGSLAGWQTGSSQFIVKNTKNYGNVNGSYAGGFIGAAHGAIAKFDNCENHGEVIEGTKEHGAGGFIGQSNAVEIRNSKNFGKVTGQNRAGGFISNATNKVTIENSSNVGEIKGGGSTYGGGIVAIYSGTKFVAKNVTTDYAHNVDGAWNVCGGGFIGTLANDNAECYFTDCVNNTNLTKGGNPGGFVGGTVKTDGGMWNAKSVTFVRCVNNGDINVGGCVGGFTGQSHIRNYTFIDCVNNGDITSGNNVASGFAGYGWNGPAQIYINCVNNGDITAQKTQDKWASGFTALGGSKIFADGCANFGTVSTNSANNRASGFFHDPATGSVIYNSFNAGQLVAVNAFEIAPGNIKIVDCVLTGGHNKIISRLEGLKPYGDLVEKDEWAAFAEAVAAAKAVLDDENSTRDDEKVVLEALEVVVADLNTYIDAPYGANLTNPSLNINVSVADGKDGDYVALVKDGDADATITVLVKDLTANFNLLSAEKAEGKTITEGTYNIYLVSEGIELADVLADKTKALDVLEVLIDANFITNADEFMAMAGKDGDFVLGADISVEGGIEFAGNFNGNGNTITLTGTNGLFYKLTDATVKNFKLEVADITTPLVHYAVAYTASGDVTIENVEVGMLTITTTDRAAAILTTVEDNQSDIVIKNVKSYASVYGHWIGAGIIGRAYVKSITLDNVVNGAEGLTTYVNTTINHDTSNFGTGGLLSDITVTEKLDIKNSANYATLSATKAKVGGIVSQFGGTATFENVVNYGNLTENKGGWAYGEGGIIGYIRSASTVTIKSSTNYGNITTDSNTNKGGFIGMFVDDAASTVTIEDCENYGTIGYDGNNKIGGFIGQASNRDNNITITDSVNYGTINGGANAGGFCGQTSGTVTLTNIKNLANVTGGRYAGGIIAYNGANVTMTNVYNGDADHKVAVKGLNSAEDWNTNGTGGIFGQAHGTLVLKNVYNYADVSVNGTRATSIGGFAGQLGNDGNFNFTATDCVNYGTVNCYGNFGAGFIGHIKYRAGQNVTFTNCDNRGNVKSNQWNRLGGFIGYAEPGAGTTVYTFENCNNYGDIATGKEAAGGFIGQVQNVTINFTECNNYGDVTANTDGNLGGFIGYGNANVIVNATDVTNEGNVSGKGNTGGFVGQPQSGTYTVTNFVNDGNVISGANFAGGFNGWGGATINLTNAVNNGNIQAVAAGKKAAGLVTAGTSTLTDCTNNGNVTSNADAAGLVAEGSTTVTGGENNGTITSTAGNAWGGFNGATEDNFVDNGTVLPNFDPTDEENFIEIWTANDFAQIKEGYSYILMDDIVLPTDYVSVALGGDVFDVIFNGNGKTVYMKGLTCALFSTIKGATVKDLTLVGNVNANAALIASVATQSYGNQVMNINIENVVVDVDIVSESGITGGFIATSGTVGAKVTNLEISNSKFLGNISSKNYAGGFLGFFATKGNVNITECVVGDPGLKTSISGYYRVAGFAGKMRGEATADQPTVTFESCVNYADLTVEHIKVNNQGEGCVGAIGGRFQNMNLNVYDCSNYGKVVNHRRFYNDKGEETNGWIQGTGGLIGEINNNTYAYFDSCSNFAEVYADKQVVGGIVGAVTHSSNITLDSCYNYGKVWNGASWNFAAGGIVGSSSGTGGFLTDNANENEIKIYASENYGLVTASNANIGGFMGTTDGSMGLLEIIGCYNYGDVICTGGNNAGGFVGQNGGCNAVITGNVNYGHVKSNGCVASGALAYTWNGNWNSLVFEDNVNYGTAENSNGDATGLIMQPACDTVAEINNNVNYGTIISSSNKAAAGVVAYLNGAVSMSGNANYGLIIGSSMNAQVFFDARNDDQKAASNIANNNVEGGMVVVDSDLVAKAKAFNAADYKLADIIGTQLEAGVVVDLTNFIFVAQDADKNVVEDFEFYYNTKVEAGKLATSVYADRTNTDVPARVYATKIASVSTDTYYEITLDAKSNGTAIGGGFVYAMATDGTPYVYTETDDTFAGSYKVVYNGLVATLYKGDVELASNLLAEGAYVAVGVSNDASTSSADQAGNVVATPVDNQKTVTIENVTFATKYYAGGIINAFKAVDELATANAEAKALADTLVAVFEATQADHDTAKDAEDNAAAIVKEKTDALAEAVKSGLRDEALEPYEIAVDEAVAAYEEAHRVHELWEIALATAKAYSEKASADSAALEASYKNDVTAAKQNIDDTIAAAINYAEYNEAVYAVWAMGNNFYDKYTSADRNAVTKAITAGRNATTQEALDEATAIIKSITSAIDWSAYNYWFNIADNLEENDYTILTWEAFVKALTEIDDSEKADQAAVDTATEQIKAEIAKLDYDFNLATEMDKYLADELVARGWIEEDFTPRSWATFEAEVIDYFQDAIDALAEAVEAGKTSADEGDIEEAEQVVRAAYERFNDEDYTATVELVSIKKINEILATYEQISDDTVDADEKIFTDISKLYFFIAMPEVQIAYNEAVDLETENAVAKKLVEDAVASIKAYYEGLTDVTELKALMAGYATEIADKVFTADTWNAYALALSKAEFAVVAARTAEEVETATADLKAAYEALEELVEINLDELNTVIEAVKDLDEDAYTNDSWDALEDALLDAKIAVYSNNQVVIDDAYAALTAAIDALVAMPKTDALTALIAEVEALKADAYTVDSWFAVVVALQNAKMSLDAQTDDEVKAAEAALKAAKEALVAKAAVDATALNALIAEVEALKADAYTADSWANVKAALESAKAALTADDQTIVDLAKATLAAAKANLDEVAVEEEAETEPAATEPAKKGCGSAIGATVVVLTATLALGATVVLKKKND